VLIFHARGAMFGIKGLFLLAGFGAYMAYRVVDSIDRGRSQKYHTDSNAAALNAPDHPGWKRNKNPVTFWIHVAFDGIVAAAVLGYVIYRVYGMYA
jgi:hypothetical protein